MVIFVFSVIVYLLLAWSGNGIDMAEVIIGIVLGAILAFAAKVWNPRKFFSFYGLNPVRWGMFIVYLFGPFLLGMIKANLDVAMRVITGKIRPGIVRINSGLKGTLATTMLANSITLTPGTLTVDISEDPEGGNLFYIHWINVTDENPEEGLVYGPFGKWARRVAE